MKHLLFTVAAMVLLSSAQLTDRAEFINAQFKRAQGDWEGFLESTEFKDNKTKYATPAKCTTSFDGKVWTYDVVYDAGNGEFFSGMGSCEVKEDGEKIDNNGVDWDVRDAVMRGDSAIIVMETQGKDNRKKAILRQTLIVTSGTFILSEEVKYLDSQEFIVRNKHLFRKKKGS
ncbi:MAG: hypothetical protein K1X54_05425 [Flavobacteriales bacterium]|nr:hypothetical protein [Flavobacteriales bacterium]